MNYPSIRKKFLIGEIERKGYFLDKPRFLEAVERSIVPGLDTPFSRTGLYRDFRGMGEGVFVSLYHSVLTYTLLRKMAINDVLSSVLSDIERFNRDYHVKLFAEETNIGARIMNRKVTMRDMVEAARTNFDIIGVFAGNVLGALEKRGIG